MQQNNPPVAQPPPVVLPPIIMGEWEETYPGSGAFNALMGGTPLADWTGIDLNIDRTVAVTTLHYRPINPVYDNKGFSKRTKGLETKFTKGKNMDLAKFQTEVWNHLTKHGLDTISYLQDPFDNTVVVNVVENHARFNKTTTAITQACETMSTHFDRWDKENDSAAKTFLLNSLDESIITEMKNKYNQSDTFTSLWLKLVQHLLTTSVTRFDTLKAKLRSLDPLRYAGQDVAKLADDYTTIANELIAAGCYDHNLTLAMVQGFLRAGDNNSRYEFPLLSIEQKLNMELPQVPFMTAQAATTHMVNEGLDFRTVCNTAADTYRTLLDNNAWGPAKLPGHSGRAIHIAEHDLTVQDIAHEVLNLVQSKYDASRTKKTIECFECGGNHLVRDCPVSKKKNDSRNDKRKLSNRRKKDEKKAWQRTPPKDGEPTTKEVKGKTFNYCQKCRRWTTTHSTNTHVSKSASDSNANDNGGSALALEWRPSLWCVEHHVDTAITAKGGMTTVTPTSSHWLPCLQIPYLMFTFSYLLHSLDLFSLNHVNLPSLQELYTLFQAISQVIMPHLQLLFAPILYFIAGYTACTLSRPKPISNEELIATKLCRHKSRYKPKFKRSSTKSLWSSCKRRLLRTLPLRLRNTKIDYNNHDAPTISQQQFNKCFNAFMQALKERPQQHYMNNSKYFNDHVQYTSHPNVANNSNPTWNNRKHHHYSKQRTKQYHNLHPKANFAVSKMAYEVYMMSTKNAVMTDPLRLCQAIGSSKSFPLIWDSGASISVTHDRSDFVTFEDISTTVDGVCSTANKVEGKGMVEWHVYDAKGKIRTLRLEAFYIPSSRTRLISTQGLLNTYPDESITIHDGELCLSGVESSKDRNAVRALVNPQNSLPTSIGLHRDALSIGVCELSKAIDTTTAKNKNISEAEKELLRWHCRLGHVGICKVQNVMRTGALAHSESTRRLHKAASKIKQHGPYCASCLFGKQSLRPSPGLTSRNIVRDRSGVSKAGNLYPGNEVSVDHFICSSKGRLFTGRGKAPDHQLYSGGCIFVDHATGYVHVEFQKSLSSHATLESKARFEETCRDFGVIPQKFLSDNGGAFTSKAFSDHLATFNQTIRFAGVGAHHHNGIAERHIRTIMSIARTMMLHSAIHWSEVADTSLWPMAVAQAVYIWNHMPNEKSGLSPIDLFSKSRWPNVKFHDIHVWGCPVYVLNKTIADGKQIPRWEPRSQRGMYMGMSPKHASSVPLVLNLETGSITPQYHVVFDDWFATVNSDVKDFPDFNSDEWMKMFGESAYQYLPTEDEDEHLVDHEGDISTNPTTNNASGAADDDFLLQNGFNQPTSIPSPIHAPPPIPIPVPSNPLGAPTHAPIHVPTTSPSHIPRGNTPTDSNVSMPPTSPTNVSPAPSQSNTSHPLPSAPPLPLDANNDNDDSWQTVGRNNKPTPSSMPLTIPNDINLRRSTRHRAKPKRLNIDNNKGNKYYTAMQLAIHFANMFTPTGELPSEPIIMKASKSKSNPDILSFDEAMTDGDRVPQWMESMQKEISELEDKNVWDVIPVSEPREAGEQIVPSTWTLRYKRAPDGTIKKMKARFCMRGDLQQDVTEPSYSPVVAFTTVRLFLIIALTLGWKTCSIDYSNAFVQAVLKKPVYLQMPRGFHNATQGKFCLKLKRSLYGSTYAPKLWYEHLFQFLVKVEGFVPSIHDPCLLFKKDMMIINYVDDSGIAYKDEATLEAFLKRLGDNGFGYTREGSFTEYLGIQYVKDPMTGKITMSQQGLIKKIIAAAGMEDCNPIGTPTTKEALGKDLEGAPMKDSWNYRSIVGMLLYLSNNTRPDLVFAVSQVARFCYAPKQSHASAVKRIVRYLAGTQDKGTIFTQPDNLNLKCYVDADFCGLFNRDPPEDSSSAKSRTGYIILVGGCYLLAKSQLQTTVALSTSEAEYYALSQAMRTVLPLRELLLEIVNNIEIPKHLKTSSSNIVSTMFEDNSSTLNLANKQHVTSRTRHYAVKFHFFWSHVKTESNPEGAISIEKIDTDKQQADYATKGMAKDGFVNCRFLNQGW